MFTFLLVLFTILSVLLVVVILIQPGKGDMGLGSIGTGTQVLFGGSGGRSFFEKLTWTMAAIFLLGALGLSFMKSSENQSSRFADFTAKPKPISSQPAQPANQESQGSQDQQADEE
jgi:preprotein translocase subunit SecG